MSVLSQGQALFASSRNQQISNCFVVDFQVGQGDVNDLLFFQLLYLFKELLHRKEDYARLLSGTSDGVRLAAARCAVGKDGCIVSVKHAVQQIPGGRFVDIALIGIFVEYTVESKSLVFDSLSIRNDTSRESLDWIVLGRIEYAGRC